MKFRIKYALVDLMIILAIILMVAIFAFAPWIREWESGLNTGYLYFFLFIFLAGSFIFKKWQKLYQACFISSNGRFKVSLAENDINISEESVILISRNKKDHQELLLVIGEPENERRKDPTLKQVEEEHDIIFFNPFKTNEFSSKFAETVIHY